MPKRKVAPEHKEVADLINRGLFADVPKWMERKGKDVDISPLLHEAIATRLEMGVLFPRMYLNDAFEFGKKQDIDVNLNKIDKFKQRVGRGVCNRIMKGKPDEAMELIRWVEEKGKPVDVKKIKGITKAIQELIPELKKLTYGSDVIQNLVKFIDTYELPLDKIPEIIGPRKRIQEYNKRY